MASPILKAGIAIDGEREFKNAVTNINSEMRVLASEMKKVTTEFGKNDTSVDGLTSKNKVLSEQIETQAEKVKILNAQVEKSADLQNKASEKMQKYRIEVENASKKLAEMKADVNSTDEEITKQEQALKDVNDQLEKSQTQYENSTKKLNNYKIQLNNAESDMNKFNNEVKQNTELLNKNETETEQASDKTKGFSTNLGGLTTSGVLAGASVGGVAGAIAGLVTSVATGGLQIGLQGISTIMTGLADASKAALDGLVSLIDQSVEYTSSIQDTADKTGLSVESLQQLRYVASMSGMDFETLSSAAIKSQRSFASAKDGSDELRTAYDRLGINIDDISNSGDAFDATLSALADMDDEVERNALSNDIFGKSYAELAPMLDLGAKGIEDMKKKASDLGIVLSDKVIADGEKFGDTLDTLKLAGSAVAQNFVSFLIPSLQKLGDDGTSYIQQFYEAMENADGDPEKMGKAIKDMLDTILTDIADGLPKIAEKGVELLGEFVGGITDPKSKTKTSGAISSILTTLGTTISDSLPIIAELGAYVIGIMLDGITGVDQQKVNDAISTTLQKLNTGLTDNEDDIDQFVTDLFTMLGTLVDTHALEISEIGTTLIMLLIKGAINAPASFFTPIVDNTIDRLKTIVNASAPILGEIGGKIAASIAIGIKNATSNVVNSVGDAIGSAIATAKGKIDDFTDIGKNIVRGIGQGIINTKDWLIDKIKELCKSVNDTIKKVFDINSPSKVTAKDGASLMEGIRVGASRELGATNNTMANLMGSVSNTMSSALNVPVIQASGNFGTSTTTSSVGQGSIATSSVNDRPIVLKIVADGKELASAIFPSMSQLLEEDRLATLSFA